MVLIEIFWILFGLDLVSYKYFVRAALAQMSGDFTWINHYTTSVMVNSRNVPTRLWFTSSVCMCVYFQDWGTNPV